MTSASPPPTRKKKNEAMRYMCPMTLWSVLDIHDARRVPVRVRTGLGRTACVVIWRSFRKGGSTARSGQDHRDRNSGIVRLVMPAENRTKGVARGDHRGNREELQRHRR